VAKPDSARNWPLLSTSAKVILALLLAALAIWFFVIKPMITG
jgi:hypothetical protein